MTMPAYPEDVLARARRIRLIGFDVDGTLTDGRLLYGNDGEIAKAFQVQDGMGLTLLRHAGIATAFVTARNSPMVARRAADLRIEHVHIGEREKLACMQRIALGMGIGMDEVAFVGDDLPDLATLRACGLAIAPANGHAWALDAAHWVTPRKGGKGAGRDACDLLLHAQGHVAGILAHGEHP